MKGGIPGIDDAMLMAAIIDSYSTDWIAAAIPAVSLQGITRRLGAGLMRILDKDSVGDSVRDSSDSVAGKWNGLFQPWPCPSCRYPHRLTPPPPRHCLLLRQVAALLPTFQKIGPFCCCCCCCCCCCLQFLFLSSFFLSFLKNIFYYSFHRKETGGGGGGGGGGENK